jgi:hypothetical protein
MRLAFLQELKEQGVTEVKWLQGAENPADLLARNLGKSACEKHAEVWPGELEGKSKMEPTRNSGGVSDQHSIESRVDLFVSEVRDNAK